MYRGYPQQERRKYNRIDSAFTARICIRHGDERRRWFSGGDVIMLRNLSASGILFAYPKILEAGTIVELSINLPPVAPLYRSARIVRTESIGPKAMHFIAAHFIETTEEETAVVEEAIGQLSMKRKRTDPRAVPLGVKTFLATLLLCTLPFPLALANGLSALAKVGESQKEMAHILDKETYVFEAVQKAVKYEQITEGQTQEEIETRYGQPVIAFSKQDAGDIWVYKPGYATWFDNIKIYLHFNTNGEIQKIESYGTAE